jgi:putative ABC transport system permease protein
VAAGGTSLTGEIEIVGVARNAKYRTVGESGQPHLYLPYAQHHAGSMSLLVRARPGPLPMQETRAAIAALDPAVQGFFTRTLDEHTRIALLPARFASRVSTIVGLVSALLGAIGLHALISCVVAERRREFGLRIALGASSRKVSRDVVGHALRLSLAGCVLGVAGALFGGGLLSSLLYGVSPSDPLVYAAVIPGAVSVAAVSAWLPARRASRVDPSIALRQ